MWGASHAGGGTGRAASAANIRRTWLIYDDTYGQHGSYTTKKQGKRDAPEKGEDEGGIARRRYGALCLSCEVVLSPIRGRWLLLRIAL